MGPLDLVRLPPLMSLSQGRSELVVALIDGPVALDHPDLAQSRILEIPARVRGSCSRVESVACMHGTFVAGMLVAQRQSAAPAICPACTLLLRPIFAESPKCKHDMPSASPEELAAAITEAIGAGAKIINLSAALTEASLRGEHHLEQALDYAAKRAVLIVAAAGNQGMIVGSAITSHPWVIPVVGCDLKGKPTSESNLGKSIGKRGLNAPGESIVSLGAAGEAHTSAGTSAAAPFVTGAIALLWSEYPNATATQIKLAVTQAGRSTRRSIVPPLLDAWAAYQVLSRN